MICPLCNRDNTAIYRMYSRSFIHDAYKNDPLFDNNVVDVSEDITDSIDLYRCMDCDIRFFEPLVTGGSNFYKQLQAFPWYYQLVKPEFEFAKKYIIPDDTVLEIGCGEGYFGQMIEAEYVGLDPYSQNPKVVKQSIQEHTGSYDVVCGFQVLEHVSETGSFISNALRCLRTNGLLILSVPNEDSFLGNIEGWALNYPPHHVTRFTINCLENIATFFNLELVSIYEEPLAEFHRSLLSDNKYTICNPDINYDVGHTVIAVYKKI